MTKRLTNYFKERYFKAYFYTNGWYPINLGIHIDFQIPNIEIHVPFGFIRIGWSIDKRGSEHPNPHNNKFLYRKFGYY